MNKKNPLRYKKPDDSQKTVKDAFKMKRIDDSQVKNNENLGSLSAKYEGQVGSTGKSKYDAGGRSYGKYQFTINSQSINEFAKDLRESGIEKYVELGKMTPGSKEFDARWEEIAAQDPYGFGSMQFKFAKKHYYDKGADTLWDGYGFDIGERSFTLKQVLFSNMIQHGPTYGPTAFTDAAALYLGKDPKTITRNEVKQALNSMDDEEIIAHIWKCKTTNSEWWSGSPRYEYGLKRRWTLERDDALIAWDREKINTKMV